MCVTMTTSSTKRPIRPIRRQPDIRPIEFYVDDYLQQKQRYNADFNQRIVKILRSLKRARRELRRLLSQHNDACSCESCVELRQHRGEDLNAAEFRREMRFNFETIARLIVSFERQDLIDPDTAAWPEGVRELAKRAPAASEPPAAFTAIVVRPGSMRAATKAPAAGSTSRRARA